jgi:hypothetical protein
MQGPTGLVALATGIEHQYLQPTAGQHQGAGEAGGSTSHHDGVNGVHGPVSWKLVDQHAWWALATTAQVVPIDRDVVNR